MSEAKTRLVALAGAALLIVAAVACEASAATLDLVRQNHEIRLAYRDDAPPFSFKGDNGEPAGYVVDLCRAVVRQLSQQLQIPTLSTVFVRVTATDRFNAILQGKADLLCEPTSATLSRREQVDFSISTYVDGASLMIRADGPRTIQQMSGRKIGVLAGTTTEQELRDTLRDGGINADVVLAKTHNEGLAMLDAGTISAYFADRGILASLINDSQAPEKLALLDHYLTIEPYALALPHADGDFRLAVDRALSQIYRSGEIAQIYARNFGDQAKPSPILEALFLISGLPN